MTASPSATRAPAITRTCSTCRPSPPCAPPGSGRGARRSCRSSPTESYDPAPPFPDLDDFRPDDSAARTVPAAIVRLAAVAALPSHALGAVARLQLGYGRRTVRRRASPAEAREGPA